MEQNAKRIGKFNVIDVIAVVLILLVLVYAGWKLANRGKNAEAPAARVHVTYVVRVENVATELYENAKAHLPSKLMASGAFVGGEIVSVDKKQHQVIAPDGQWVDDPAHADLYFTVDTTVADGPVMLTKIGDQEVRVGKKDYILKSEYVEFSGGTVIDVQWDR